MKFAFGCSLFIAACFISEAIPTYDWEWYKREFGKKYLAHDEEYRRSVFEQNLVAYAKLNALEPLAHYGPTAMSDMKPEEYLKGYKPSFITIPALEVDTSLEIPDRVDWTDKYTTPIKDQGSCGSCWAESATEQVESDAMRQHNFTGLLSVQELVDCTKKGQGSWRGGCGGGDPTAGYKVFQAVGGVVSGYDYKYEGRDARCNVNNFTKYVQVDSFKSVGKHDETTMKSYVGTTGTLSVCVDANDWGGYSGGIKTTCGNSVDHCVQIVGYGSEADTEYWKVRNSWGAAWGEKGFMRLAIGKNLCKIASEPTATSTSHVVPAPTPSPGGCHDVPKDWRSSEGDPCSIYELNSYCTAEGREGLGWNHCAWGSITDYADDKGISALQACCACGGGSDPAPPLPPTPAPPPSNCTDDPKNWKSSEGDSCCAYVWDSYCTPQGGEGPSWDPSWGPISDYADKQGISALQACCGCGGGKKRSDA